MVHVCQAHSNGKGFWQTYSLVVLPWHHFLISAINAIMHCDGNVDYNLFSTKKKIVPCRLNCTLPLSLCVVLLSGLHEAPQAPGELPSLWPVPGRRDVLPDPWDSRTSRAVPGAGAGLCQPVAWQTDYRTRAHSVGEILIPVWILFATYCENSIPNQRRLC